MAYYLIHACNKRFWYVKEYLIPSMMLQGIPAENIFVYRDYNEQTLRQGMQDKEQCYLPSQLCFERGNEAPASFHAFHH